jgi:pimeloyl-ACP methyl ester carboxylesterase
VTEGEIPVAIRDQLEGLARQMGPSANEGPRGLLPADAQRMRTWALWQVKHWASGDNPVEHEELAAIRAIRTGSEHPLGDLPLVVIRRGVHDGGEARFVEEHRVDQEAVARMSRRGRVIVAERSGHHVQLEQPELVIAAIREVLDASRSLRP